MEYTVKKLAQLSGVSTRTLRYYDEIGLLKPERINTNGYRIYGQTQIELLIKNVNTTIRTMKGERKMSDQEKFEGFKKKLVTENEESYGQEIREKYGNQTVDASNDKLSSMTEQQWEEQKELAEEINRLLKQVCKEGNPGGTLAQKECDLHRQWICMFWPEGTYSKEAHRGLGEMYVADERFRAYYDKIDTRAAEFLRDALTIYLS